MIDLSERCYYQEAPGGKTVVLAVYGFLALTGFASRYIRLGCPRNDLARNQIMGNSYVLATAVKAGREFRFQAYAVSCGLMIPVSETDPVQ